MTRTGVTEKVLQMDCYAFFITQIHDLKMLAVFGLFCIGSTMLLLI